MVSKEETWEEREGRKKRKGKQQIKIKENQQGHTVL